MSVLASTSAFEREDYLRRVRNPSAQMDVERVQARNALSRWFALAYRTDKLRPMGDGNEAKLEARLLQEFDDFLSEHLA